MKFRLLMPIYACFSSWNAAIACGFHRFTMIPISSRGVDSLVWHLAPSPLFDKCAQHRFWYFPRQLTLPFSKIGIEDRTGTCCSEGCPCILFGKRESHLNQVVLTSVHLARDQQHRTRITGIRNDNIIYIYTKLTKHICIIYIYW